MTAMNSVAQRQLDDDLTSVCRSETCTRVELHRTGDCGACVRELRSVGRVPHACARCHASLKPPAGQKAVARCNACGWDRARDGDPRARLGQNKGQNKNRKNQQPHRRAHQETRTTRALRKSKDT